MEKASLLAVVFCISAPTASFAPPAGDDFFKGKVIRIVVGFSAGAASIRSRAP